MTMSDEHLVLELQNGSKQAFAELYQRYKYRIYTYCLRMLRDADRAQDTVQGIFLKMYERSRQIRNPERFQSWLYTTARHDCLSNLRQQSKNSDALDTLERSELGQNSSPAPEQTSGLVRAIAEAVGKLPPELREVVILREYEDFSYEEISEITGVKIGLVKFRLFTARKKLAERLNRVLKGTAKHELQ